MTRKHRGIIQEGDNKGRLRKGFFYSGKRTKNGLPIIKEKKHNQNGGTRRNLIRQAATAAASLGLGASRIDGPAKTASQLTTKLPKQPLLKSLPSTLPPSLRTTLPASLPPSLPPSLESTKSIIDIHIRTGNLFNRILNITKSKQNTKNKSNSILNNFIKETINSFLNPMQEGDLFGQLSKFEPIVILRIIVKTTRSLIENLAQANTEEEIKTTFNNNFNSFLSEEMLNENLKSNDLSQRPLRDLFYNNPLNQTLLLTNNNIKLLTKNKNQLFNNKENILNLLNEYCNTLSGFTN